MPGSVLIVDDDKDVSTLVAGILIDAGFTVAELANLSPEAIQAEVARIERDVILLDGANKVDYGESWADAAWLHERERPIAVIMFYEPCQDTAEGELGETERSRRAALLASWLNPSILTCSLRS